jgi:hypothetical protein
MPERGRDRSQSSMGVARIIGLDLLTMAAAAIQNTNAGSAVAKGPHGVNTIVAG